MKHTFTCLLCSAFVLCAACGRPEDESPSKFQRKANIEKYVQKAKSAGRLSMERAKPLEAADPLDVSRLTNQTQNVQTGFLDGIFERNRLSLERRLQQAYAERSAARVSELLDKYREQARQAAMQASGPAALSSRLREVFAAQDAELEAFLAAQDAVTRLKPDQALLDRSKERLRRRCDDFTSRMQLYYGTQAAQQCRPVLDKALEDYVYAMAGASTTAELDAKLKQIQSQTARQIGQIASLSGDPLGVTPEDVITSLRADMINTHQKLEERVEALYGKDAVLAARKVFNRLLEEGGKTLRENARLSQKKRAAAHLNQHYRQSLLDLQQQWNAALDASSGRPPDYALSSH